MSKPFLVHRRVRFGDCDPGGVIYTPRLSYFVVEAILDFVSHRLGGPAEKRLMDLGIFPPARSFTLEFLSPLEWDAEIEMQVRVAEMRTHAIKFVVDGYLESGEKTFAAELTQVCVDVDDRKPVPIPNILRAALSES